MLSSVCRGALRRRRGGVWGGGRRGWARGEWEGDGLGVGKRGVGRCG